MARTGRPRGFDQDTALQGAMELFWRCGYEPTSLQDLVDELGLNRSSLYAAFGDKHELYLRALDRYVDTTVRTTDERLGGTDAPVRATLRAWLHDTARALCAFPDRRGCLVVNTATELGTRDPAAAERVDRALGGLHDTFAAALRRGQATGELPAALDPEAAAGFLVTTVVGLRARARTAVAEDELHASVEMALRVLD